MSETLSIIKPDDFHLHLRDGDILSDTINQSARTFQRAVIMPNLVPPITTVDLAQNYYNKIINQLNDKNTFTPLMTLYLTDHTSKDELILAKNSSIIHGVKLYPAGATTHSHQGVTKINALFHLFETMQEIDLPLLIHGEVTDWNVDIFDRETKFIEDTLQTIIQQFPKLRIVLEHISTKTAVEFISSCNSFVAATITPQHLYLNRNAIFKDGINPHHYCLPILKRKEDQLALINAAISGDPHFFLGTDSAPHAIHQKEKTCGCAGIYSAPTAISVYAEIFSSHNALDKFENFASRYGADFYKIKYNQTRLTLKKKPWQVPLKLSLGSQTVVPMCSGEMLSWQVIEEN